MHLGAGTDRRRRLGLFLLALSLVVPVATAASTVPHFQGDVAYTSAESAGASTIQGRVGTLLADRPIDEGATNGTSWWVLRADAALVNWTYQRRASAGTSPSGDPMFARTVERDSGERRYAAPTLQTDALPGEPRVLVVPGPDDRIRTAGETASTVRVRPAGNATWWVGEGDSPGTTAGNEDIYVRQTHDLKPDRPLLTAGNETRWTLTGDLTIYVWYANLTVQSQNRSTDAYRTGTWTTDDTGNEVVDRSAAREQHVQLVRVEAVNASLRVDAAPGTVRWTTPEAEVRTTGRVALTGLRGQLVADRETYAFHGGSVAFEGRIRQQITGASETGGIEGILEGQEVDVGDLPPTAEVRPTSTLPTPTAGVPWLVVALAASGTLFGLGVWQFREWTSREDEHAADLVAAEEALVAHDSETARKHALAILDEDPRDADAWFAYAASLIQDGEFEQVIDELGPMVVKLDEGVEGPAFYLAYAHAALDQVEDAVDWAIDAAQEPSLREKILSWSIFGRVRRHPRFRETARRWEDDPDRDRAYG